MVRVWYGGRAVLGPRAWSLVLGLWSLVQQWRSQKSKSRYRIRESTSNRMEPEPKLNKQLSLWLVYGGYMVGIPWDYGGITSKRRVQDFESLPGVCSKTG